MGNKPKFLKDDLIELEDEIFLVKKREKDIDSFNKLKKVSKPIWNAYYLEILEFEKRKIEYFQQKYNELINTLRTENQELKDKISKILKPISYDKLKDFANKSDPLNELFVITISVKDLHKIMNNYIEVAKSEISFKDLRKESWDELMEKSKGDYNKAMKILDNFQAKSEPKNYIQTNGSLDCCSKEEIKRNEENSLKCTICNNTGYLSPKKEDSTREQIKEELNKDYL